MSILTQSQLGILCLNETWLDNTITNSQIHIPGYVIERRDRNRCGGGVLMYIRDDIDYELRTDIASVNNLVESLWVEIKCIDSMPCLISSIYRPPSARVGYYNGILDILDKASLEDKDIILSADLNIDYIMDESLSSNPAHHIEILYGISQIVTKPTRVMDKSSTLIDVILTTMPELHSYTDVYEFALSDHFLVYTCVNSPISKAKHKTVRNWCYKNFEINDFLHDIEQSSLCERSSIKDGDVDQAWCHWKTEFLRICDKHAPVSVSRVNIGLIHGLTRIYWKWCMRETFVKEKLDWIIALRCGQSTKAFVIKLLPLSNMLKMLLCWSSKYVSQRTQKIIERTQSHCWQ